MSNETMENKKPPSEEGVFEYRGGDYIFTPPKSVTDLTTILEMAKTALQKSGRRIGKESLFVVTPDNTFNFDENTVVEDFEKQIRMRELKQETASEMKRLDEAGLRKVLEFIKTV